MSQRAVIAFAVVSAALLASPSQPTGRPLIVWNATASAPLGFYRIEVPAKLRDGDLVLLRPDVASAAAYAARGYLPRGVPLLKPVAATAGTRVCERDGRVAIGGTPVALALTADGRGRPMTAWTGCRKLAGGELFVLNAAVPTSLDGRYFGPSKIAAVIGRAVPLWTWSAPR